MSTPEISKRCQTCGIPVSRDAAFCPECGSQINASTAGPAIVEQRAEKRADLTGEAQKAVTTNLPSPRMPEAKRPSYSRATTKLDQKDLPVADGRTSEVPKPRHGAASAVKEKLMPQVGKIKNVSHAVVDEAAVDPSFRFLLVAAAIFILFLLLLFISNFLR
jgi:hypothetical protein